MNKFSLLSLLILSCFIFSCQRQSSPPLSLHPENPHYFLFRGKPTVLIGSTEHYGAVMNLDFDYLKYLDETAASGLNVTRTFTGVYVEPPGAFGIEKNTMAPDSLKFTCPWKRSNEPGYAVGGNKFDLTQWDDTYFQRLKDFITEAGKRNIVVELDFFSNYYDTLQWKLSPLYIANNINNIGNIKNHKEILALSHPEIFEVQEKMVRKIIDELKDFDNLYYEVCNEPYFGDLVALEAWEEKMTNVIIDAEKDFKFKHPISQNIANGKALVKNPHPGVSIFNFHYAKPPVAVPLNYHLNRVIGDNETGFNGIGDATYRTEAWAFLLAGGALYNNLDYSFTTDNEDGTHIIKKGQPGGGGKNLRNQLRILHDFMNSMDFIQMSPDTVSIKILNPDSCTVNVLSKKNELYAAYLNNYKTRKVALPKDTVRVISEIEANLPKGSYEITWIDTKNGTDEIYKLENHEGGPVNLTSPSFQEDIALKIKPLKN